MNIGNCFDVSFEELNCLWKWQQYKFVIYLCVDFLNVAISSDSHVLSLLLPSIYASFIFFSTHLMLAVRSEPVPSELQISTLKIAYFTFVLLLWWKMMRFQRSRTQTIFRVYLLFIGTKKAVPTQFCQMQPHSPWYILCASLATNVK